MEEEETDPAAFISICRKLSKFQAEILQESIYCILNFPLKTKKSNKILKMQNPVLAGFCYSLRRKISNRVVKDFIGFIIPIIKNK
jgi:hypothetical protein